MIGWDVAGVVERAARDGTEPPAEEDTARLDEASAPIVDDYPYGDQGVEQRDRTP